MHLDETTPSLSHPYDAYPGYAAVSYYRQAMALDPGSLQLYPGGLLGPDPTSTAAFRVNEILYTLPVMEFSSMTCLDS